jgi:MFS family permease
MSAAVPHSLLVPAHEPDEASPGYRGWRVVFACFVMAMLCWGFGFYGHGFYLAELQHRNAWPASLIASASTLYYLFSAFLVVFINDAIRRFSARVCVLVGALALAGSAATLPFITEPWQLFAAYLVMAFAWATMSLGAINNILGLWFERKRGLAISLALNGASFGGVIIVPGLVFVTGAAGFTTAMLIGAAVVLALMVPIALRILGNASPQHSAGDDRDPSARKTPWTRGSALRSLAFWSASAPFALAITSQAGFLVHQIAFLEPTIGRYSAGIAVAITTSMAIVGRLTLGSFAERLNQRHAAALSLAAQAAALAVMTQTGDATVLLAACAVYGFSVGNVITFPSLIIQREFETAAFGMLIGLSTGLSQFTYAFGPGLLGLARDATGDYGAALSLCIALNLIAAAIVLRRPNVRT